MNRIVVALTGASGMPYARELFAYLQGRPELEVHVISSPAAEQVLRLEEKLSVTELVGTRAILHDVNNFAAPLASGSFLARALVVMPCTMGTLAGIAQGISLNLIHRTADVFLKERRPVLLVVRETPLSRIHIHNMLLATDAGATIFPAMPGFYHRPRDLRDLARNFVGRILDHLGLEHDLTRRWGE